MEETSTCRWRPWSRWGAEGHRGGLEELAEHDPHGALAAAEAGVDGEEGEHVGEAQHVVDDEGAGVVADQCGALLQTPFQSAQP